MIKLYTTPSCGYCVAAKRLLQRRGHIYEEIDVRSDPSLRWRISESVGHYRMVPMIFINDQFIGGYDELAELDRRGELEHQVHGEAPVTRYTR